MKKKILTTLFAIVIICLFAFSVSAENEVTLVGGEKADFEAVFKIGAINDVDNIVLGFNAGYDKNSITDVIFPDEINGIECNYLFSSATELNTLTFGATDTFFISGDGMFSGCSVKTITFNPKCVVELRKGNFSDCASLTQITFPKFKALAGSAFLNCASMQATNELVLAEGMTDIGGHAFNGCTSLRGTVYFPSTLESIQEYSFQKSGFDNFDLSKCSKLSAVGGKYGGPFTDCANITRLDLSGCTSLTDLKKCFAQSCASLSEVILPPNLKTVPEKAFAQCNKLQSVVLPATCTSVGDEAFMQAGNGLTTKTFTLYIQSNVAFITTGYGTFNQSNSKIEFVLFGDAVTVDSFKSANTDAKLTGSVSFASLPAVDYMDPESKWGYTVGGAITSHTIVANYCEYLALTKSHSATDAICANDDYCEDCAYHTCQSHEGKLTISYPNGYDADGQKQLCNLKDCGASKITRLEPLFEAVGYSIRENNGYGILSTYQVNKDALGEFESVNGRLTIGIIIANADFDGQSEFMSKNSEGKYVLNTSNGIQTQMSASAYSRIYASVNQFTQNEATLNLVMALYVVDANGISYIQREGAYAGEVTKDATLDIVTIAKIAELGNVTLPFVVPTQPSETKENI